MPSQALTGEKPLYKSNEELIQKALAALEAEATYGEIFDSANKAGRYLRLKLAPYAHEVFAVAFLDIKHQLIAFEEMFSGTIDKTAVYPNRIARAALLHNASALILAHNHPSGSLEPSETDKSLTKQLTDALALIDVTVLDNIVVSKIGHKSMKDLGLV